MQLTGTTYKIQINRWQRSEDMQFYKHTHTPMHARTSTHTQRITQSTIYTETQLSHSCMHTHSWYPREILGNRKWQQKEEVVPEWGQISSGLYQAEERETGGKERGHSIQCNDRKRQQGIRHDKRKKLEKESKYWGFRTWLSLVHYNIQTWYCSQKSQSQNI